MAPTNAARHERGVEERGEIGQRVEALVRDDHRRALGSLREALEVDAGRGAHEAARLGERRLELALGIDEATEAKNAVVPEPSTFDFAGRTFLTGDRPTSISIPVQAIFEMSVEEVVPDLYEVAWGYTYTSKLVLLVDTEVVPGNPRHELEAMNAQELSDAIKTEVFMINKKASLHDSEDRVFLKETVREIVKVPCKYCGTLNEITKQNCHKCGAPIK